MLFYFTDLSEYCLCVAYKIWDMNSSDISIRANQISPFKLDYTIYTQIS